MKNNVIIGNNGNKTNNHIKIITSLSALDQEVKKNTLFILPLAYALTDEYKSELIETCNSSDLKTALLFTYLSWEDLAKLKIAVDVLIMMPVSDSFSSYFIESLYAGNKCIVGSWLPYEIFRRIGLRFWEADDFENLPSILEKVLKSEYGNIKDYRKIIRNNFYSKRVVEKWKNIL